MPTREHVPSFIQHRRDICAKCKHNINGICQELKRQVPGKAAVISIGIRIPKAYCPIGKWDKAEPEKRVVKRKQTGGACRICGNLALVQAGICSNCKVDQEIRQSKKRAGLRLRPPYDPTLTGKRGTPLTIGQVREAKKAIPPQVTVCITTFDQPHKVYTCVHSVFSRYPTAQVLLADNGFTPVNKDRFVVPPTGKFQLLRLEPDVGVSYSRNRMAEMVATPYLLLMEDDFIMDERCNVWDMYDICSSSPEIGVTGGWHEYEYRKRKLGYPSGLEGVDQKLFISPPSLYTPNRTKYHCVEFVSNFALFKTECMLQHKWNEDCKMGEHYEYYLRMKHENKWIITHCPSSQVGHDRMRRTFHYSSYRGRAHKIKEGVVRTWKSKATPTRLNKTPTCVLIATTGRSGSSMLSGILARLGYCMSIRDVPATWHNPRGYYEDSTILQATQEIKQSSKNKDELAQAVHHFSRLIQHRNITQIRWGIKLPLLTQLWKHVESCPWPKDVRVINITRNSHSVESSIQRVGHDPSNASHWYKRRVKNAARFLQDAEDRGWPICNVDYDSILQDQESQVKTICQFIGGDENRIREAVNFIDPSLNHFPIRA